MIHLKLMCWKGIDEYICNRPNYVCFKFVFSRILFCDRHYFFLLFLLPNAVFGQTGKTFFVMFCVFLLLTHVASIRVISLDKLAHSAIYRSDLNLFIADSISYCKLEHKKYFTSCKAEKLYFLRFIW